MHVHASKTGYFASYDIASHVVYCMPLPNFHGNIYTYAHAYIYVRMYYALCPVPTCILPYIHVQSMYIWGGFPMGTIFVIFCPLLKRTLDYSPLCQVLNFVSYKDLGEVLLATDHAHFLCEGMEEVGLRLATMLVSRHMTPLRDEAGQWAARLARVNDILTQVWILLCTCTCTYMCMCMHNHTHTCTCGYVHVHDIYVHVYTYMYMCTCII